MVQYSRLGSLLPLISSRISHGLVFLFGSYSYIFEHCGQAVVSFTFLMHWVCTSPLELCAIYLCMCFLLVKTGGLSAAQAVKLMFIIVVLVVVVVTRAGEQE